MSLRTGIEQGSDQWQRARLGIVTGSKLGKCFTTKLAISKAGCDTLGRDLACEYMHRKNNTIPEFYENSHMIRGSFMEAEAVRALAFQYDDMTCIPGGFYLDADKHLGASPDAIFAKDGIEIMGGEVKCPKIENHLKYLIDGGVPPLYYPQVQHSMLVTGLDKWVFCSYYPGANLHKFEQERDDEFFEKINEVVEIVITKAKKYAKVLGV